MEFIIYTFVFVIGLAIGSFLNVVAMRLERGVSITGRSRCGACDALIRWFDNVPIISWLVLKGLCRRCRSPISLQYPAVEIATAVLFLGMYLHLPFGLEVFGWMPAIKLLLLFVISALLVLIFIYDLYHKIIPDDMVYAFMGSAFLFGLINFSSAPASSALAFWDILAGPILFVPFALLFFVSRGRWIGFGDAKLAVGMGWLLGFVGGINAVIVAFWIGAVTSLILMALTAVIAHLKTLAIPLPYWLKHLTIKSEIPFGPFLIVSTLLVLFFGWDPMSIGLLLYLL